MGHAFLSRDILDRIFSSESKSRPKLGRLLRLTKVCKQWRDPRRQLTCGCFSFCQHDEKLFVETKRRNRFHSLSLSDICPRGNRGGANHAGPNRFSKAARNFFCWWHKPSIYSSSTWLFSCSRSILNLYPSRQFPLHE